MSGSILDFGTDISNAEPPPPLPKGPYPAEIIAAGPMRISGNGNPIMPIQFRINAENYPADYVDGDPDGTTLTYWRMPWEKSKKAAYAWRKFMEHVGGPLGPTIDPMSVLGLTATVEVTHQEFEGVMQASLARVLAP